MKNLFKSNIALWQFCGFAVTSFFGTILHFLYDWTGVKFIALFSSVNESTWEHMKLLFFPMFLFAVVQSFFIGKQYENFWCVKLKGIILGLILIPTIFYTLNGVFGKTADWVNISIFFISAAIVYIYETRIFNRGSEPCILEKWSFIFLVLIAVAFGVFTFYPPEIPIFQDPTNSSYGIQN